MAQRSAGTSRTASTPARSRSQKAAGLLAPPGNRQPIPTIAIGSALSSATLSFSPRIRCASRASFTADRAEICSGALIVGGLSLERHPIARAVPHPQKADSILPTPAAEEKRHPATLAHLAP